jgi:hypothetical protein
LFGQRHAGAVGEQTTGTRTDADNDPGWTAGQRGDVGQVAGGAAQLVNEKPCAVGDLLWRWLRYNSAAPIGSMLRS